MANKKGAYARQVLKICKDLIILSDKAEAESTDKETLNICAKLRDAAYKIRGMAERYQDLEKMGKKLERLIKKPKRNGS